MEAARSGIYAPITAKDYVQIVRGFNSISFERTGDLSWRVIDRGALQTLRFDNAENLALVMKMSSGVLGATRKDSDLYVSLDPNVSDPMVTLASDGVQNGVVLEDGAVAIVKSDFALSGFYRDGCNTGLTAKGYAPGHIVGVAKPNDQVEVSLPDADLFLATGADGTFRVDVPSSGPISLVFRTDCGGG